MAVVYSMESESFDAEPYRAVRLLRSQRSFPPKVLLSEALAIYTANRSVRTVGNSMVLEFFDLGASPDTTRGELVLDLKPWQARMQLYWLEDTHAFAVFHSTQARMEVRRALGGKFNTEAPSRDRTPASTFRTSYLEKEPSKARPPAGEVGSWRRGDAWAEEGDEDDAPAPQPEGTGEAGAAEFSLPSAPASEAPSAGKYVPPNLRAGGLPKVDKAVLPKAPSGPHPFDRDRERKNPPPAANMFQLLGEEDD